ncbi:sialate:O-sulfotransferase 1 [Trichomycterus rosablanca]|uniref:sialate:O-sulfotransferase 1 n=1 Tax=Trichomycterus rosablanca TaxID=2290929 RepID=UPI002F360BF0
MGKTVYRLKRFLRQAQLLLFFLGVAYIMAGSVVLLQRSNMALFQRETNVPSESLSIPLRSLDAPSINLDLADGRANQEHFMSRKLKLRHLRCQENMAEHNPSQRETRQIGTYIGCFTNDDKQLALGGTVLYDLRKMTSSLCQDTCSQSGYRFAGLEYATDCHCGNHIGAPRARNEDCYLECRVERGSPCGGVARLSIYKVDEWIFGHRRYRNVHYYGCFQIPKNTLTGFQLYISQPNVTSQLCVETCTDQELPLAVLRGRDCLCGHTSSFPLMQKTVEEQLCGWSEPENHTSSADYLQVYSTPLLESQCREKMFLPESTSSLIALSSFPGAGNTWLRHLIELATGFYTGSYYFDGSLYNKGFKGEKDYWRSGRTICVKTHESGPKEIEAFDSAILLIRNPYRCLIAEFNRKNAGHLGYATDSHWKSQEWPEFVESYSLWWVSHALAWLKFPRNVLVVHYEKLQMDLVTQLRHITSFLNVSVSDDRLLCADSNRDGHFKRSRTHDLSFDPFSVDMRTRIDGYIREVDRALRDRNLTGLPQEYMPR